MVSKGYVFRAATDRSSGGAGVSPAVHRPRLAQGGHSLLPASAVQGAVLREAGAQRFDSALEQAQVYPAAAACHTRGWYRAPLRGLRTAVVISVFCC